MNAMVKLNIFVREDLNMNPGKIVSQAAHALGAFFLGCFDFDRKTWKTTAGKSCFGNVLTPETMAECIAVVMADDASCLNGCDIVITDMGRTCFKGVKTQTVGMKIDQHTKLLFGFEENPHEATDTNVRMSLVVNKLLVRKDKSAAIKQGVIAYGWHIVTLLNAYADGKLSESAVKEFLAWCSGSFAKITLVANAGNMATCIDALANEALKTLMQQNEEPSFIVIGPKAKEAMDPFTQDFKML